MKFNNTLTESNNILAESNNILNKVYDITEHKENNIII
jgi:hypothetical protein